MRPLPPAEAYRLWAGSYDAENAVTALEDAAAQTLTPPLAGSWLLDVGCGTGRRLRWAAGAGTAAAPRDGRGIDAAGGVPPARLAGVDLVPAMLAAGVGDGEAGAGDREAGAGVREASAGVRIDLLAGDVLALPVVARRFNVVWCRLVLGHLPPESLAGAYAELSRIAAPAAVLVVTDFHPAAAAAGHRRTFRDAAGRVHEVRHYVHSPADHDRAARAAGWRAERRLEPAVGPDIRDYYERAGRLDRYEADFGQPLVLAVAYSLGAVAEAGPDAATGADAAACAEVGPGAHAGTGRLEAAPRDVA